MNDIDEKIKKTAEAIRNTDAVTLFTGKKKRIFDR